MKRPTCRVSCAGLCRIEIGGRFLVEINKNRGDILTPIGGALEFLEEARAFLVELGAVFEKGYDLRLVIPVAELPRFEAWFGRRELREKDPTRELREELGKEHGLLLPAGQLWQPRVELLHCVRTAERTSRRGLEGIVTEYFFEIFDVNLGVKTAGVVSRAVDSGASRLAFVTKAEIERGVTETGLGIATSVNALFGDVELRRHVSMRSSASTNEGT